VRNILNMSREELLAALRAPAAAADAPGAPAIVAERRVAARWSNAEQRRKAEQYLATGDVLFREQKFHSALQRYKLASQTAPDMAEAFWRQGHALVATANYELAGGAFKRAIALDTDVSRGGFALDEIYGGAAMAKQAHLESLAGWALTRGDASEPYFLMGVQLQFDGQTERAAGFFDRAAELAGAGGEYLAAFAAEPAAADEAPVIEKKKAADELAVSAPVEI
jgi:tetratricopeptide (TPR) repeat protein